MEPPAGGAGWYESFSSAAQPSGAHLPGHGAIFQGDGCPLPVYLRGSSRCVLGISVEPGPPGIWAADEVTGVRGGIHSLIRVASTRGRCKSASSADHWLCCSEDEPRSVSMRAPATCLPGGTLAGRIATDPAKHSLTLRLSGASVSHPKDPLLVDERKPGCVRIPGTLRVLPPSPSHQSGAVLPDLETLPISPALGEAMLPTSRRVAAGRGSIAIFLLRGLRGAAHQERHRRG